MDIFDRWEGKKPDTPAEAATFAVIDELSSRRGFDLYGWDRDIAAEFLETATAKAQEAISRGV